MLSIVIFRRPKKIDTGIRNKGTTNLKVGINPRIKPNKYTVMGSAFYIFRVIHMAFQRHSKLGPYIHVEYLD